MTTRLRAILLSKPVIVIVGLAVAYLLAGFLLVPALVKWQAPKLVQEKLQHALTLGDVRFNPILLKFEVDKLSLADASGAPMLGFDQLVVDFETRSIVEWAWTFARISVARPRIDVALDASGRHNFQNLLDRLASDEPPSEGPPPRLIVDRIELSDGRVAYSDRALAEPGVATLEPVSIEIDALSTLLDKKGSYKIAARSGDGEIVELGGLLGLRPVTAQGRAEIKALALRTIARALNRQVALANSAGKFDLAADFDLVVSGEGALSGRVDKATLAASGVSVAAGDSTSPLAALASIAVEGVAVDLGERKVEVAAVRVAEGSVAATIDVNGTLDWSRLVVVSSGAAAAATAGAATGAASGATTGAASSVPSDAQPVADARAAADWQVAIAKVELAGVAASFDDRAQGISAKTSRADLAFSSSLKLAPASIAVTLEKPALSTGSIEYADRSSQLRTSGAAIRLASVNAAIAGEKTSVESGPIELDLSSFEFADSSAQLQLAKAALQVASMRAEVEGAKAKLGVGAVNVELSSPEFKEGGRQVSVARALLGAAQTEVETGSGPLELRSSGLSAAIDNVVVRGAGDIGEAVKINSTKLDGGSFDLAKRLVELGNLGIDGGSARAWLDAKGELSLARLGQGGDAKQAGKAAPKAADSTPPWRVVVAQTAVSGFAFDFEDRGRTPVVKTELTAIALSVSKYDTASVEPVAIDAKAQVKSGGSVAARGQLHPDTGAADLRVEVSRLALAPAQPILSQFALLRLGSGSVSAQGRLRYGSGGIAAGSLAYDGSFAVDDLLLEEIAQKRTFLAWKSVRTDDTKLTVAPNRLDIGELRVDGPVSRLVIAEDRSVNLTDVLKRKPAEPGAASAAAQTTAAAAPTAPAAPAAARATPAATPAASAPAAAAPASGDDPFPVTIARVRIDRGVLEFADLSLRPQFGTRMHDLKGVITGLGTSATSRAKVQLDARVDEFGSAKITGEIRPLRAREFTDIEMAFRNIEMTAMSPYSIKFAGYKINSGKLSLDLQYKIQGGKLQGANKAVLNQIELGERVESPDALNLPLELAIALLKDSNGVIDVDVPISGDLNDPQFSYGAVVWKAIGNLIARIVTAPFRALGALLGAGGGEDIDSIDFATGSAVLEPPQKAKVKSIAGALAKRPGLKLIVPPTYSQRDDEAALKSESVRRAIVIAMGLKLAPDEDPGPVDTSNPRARSAIEAVFAKRYAPEVLAAIKRRAATPAPAAPAPSPGASGAPGATPSAAGTSAAAAGAAPAPGAALPDAFYDDLVQRMIDETPVEAAALEKLARARAEAIVAELKTANGVGAGRVEIGEVREAAREAARASAARAGTGEAAQGAPPPPPESQAPSRTVTTRLELGVGK